MAGVRDPTGGNYIHLGSFGGPPPDPRLKPWLSGVTRPMCPPHESIQMTDATDLIQDTLADFAARAEAAAGISGNRILVTIRVEDASDGKALETVSVGFPDLIRALACLPTIPGETKDMS